MTRQFMEENSLQIRMGDALKDGTNDLLGQVRASGIYANEDGKVGTIQQIDIAC